MWSKVASDFAVTIVRYPVSLEMYSDTELYTLKKILKKLTLHEQTAGAETQHN